MGRALRDAATFAAVRVLDAGLRIAWPGTDVDFGAQGLWEDANPRPAAPTWMSGAEFTAWLREIGWSYGAGAEALGVSPRMLKYYASGSHPVPKPIWLARMHLAAQHAGANTCFVCSTHSHAPRSH